MREVSMMHEIMSMQHVWNDANREIRSNWREICPLPLYSRNTTRVLVGDFTLSSAMRSRRKTRNGSRKV